MGFSYGGDGEHLRAQFECACGSKRAERVTVKRADGADYETEFAKCCGCTAMFHWPHLVPAFMPTGGVPDSYGMLLGTAPELTEEARREILAAAARATKSRKRR